MFRATYDVHSPPVGRTCVLCPDALSVGEASGAAPRITPSSPSSSRAPRPQSTRHRSFCWAQVLPVRNRIGLVRRRRSSLPTPRTSSTLDLVWSAKPRGPWSRTTFRRFGYPICGSSLLTHLHSDHTTGYPDLILAPWVLGRRTPLEVYGPPGTRAMTEALLEAYREDIRVRIEGPEGLSAAGWTVDVTEVEVGVVHMHDQVQVEAFAVPHGIWEYAFGYRFTSKDRTIVISGDTGPFDGLVEIARGADVLVHEAYATRGFNRRSAETQRYHSTFHTLSHEAGRAGDRSRRRHGHPLPPASSRGRERRRDGRGGPVNL